MQCFPFTDMPTNACCWVQYVVSVVGMDVNGTITPGNNTLPFTTPPTLELSSANATSPTSGTATATPSPNNPFTSVRLRVLRDCARHACRQVPRRPGCGC